MDPRIDTEMGTTPDVPSDIEAETITSTIALTLASDLLTAVESEKSELLDRSLDLLEETIQQAKIEDEEKRRELEQQLNELRAAFEKSERQLHQCEADKLACEEKYVALLTTHQQQSKSFAMYSEVEEALSLAQNRMSEYASENAHLRAKLESADHPSSAQSIEKEQQAMQIVQLQSQLSVVEAERDAALEEAALSAQSEQEAEQQIMDLAKQAEDALSKVAILQADLEESQNRCTELNAQVAAQAELLLAGASSPQAKMEKEELEAKLKQAEEKLKQTMVQRMEEYNSFEKKRAELKSSHAAEVSQLWDELKEAQTKLVEAESLVEKMTFEMSLGIGQGTDVSNLDLSASVPTSAPVAKATRMKAPGSKLPAPGSTAAAASSTSGQ